MIKGIQALRTEVDNAIRDLEKEAATEVQRAAETVLNELLKRTPVWSGETVANYVVSTSPSPGASRRPSGGPPGPTNTMSLGSEPNRKTNEAIARQGLNSLGGGKLRAVYITNAVSGKKWDLIDNGAAPSKDRARNPGGVSKIALQSARRLLENFK